MRTASTLFLSVPLLLAHPVSLPNPIPGLPPIVTSSPYGPMQATWREDRAAHLPRDPGPGREDTLNNCDVDLGPDRHWYQGSL